MMESTRVRSRNSVRRNVSTTGNGSASPVVSTTRESTLWSRARMRKIESMKLLLIEQQMQPFSSSTMSSSAETISSLSMPSSLNSLTMTAVRSPCWLVRNVLHQRGLAAAEKARDHGHGQARFGAVFGKRRRDANHDNRALAPNGNVLKRGAVLRRASRTFYSDRWWPASKVYLVPTADWLTASPKAS